VVIRKPYVDLRRNLLIPPGNGLNNPRILGIVKSHENRSVEYVVIEGIIFDAPCLFGRQTEACLDFMEIRE
jgi:hypothetical protein